MNQSQQFTELGKRIPVTFIQAGPCFIARTTDMGDYRSVQLTMGVAKHITKAEAGHLKKSGLDIKPRFLREIRTTETIEELTPGKEVKLADIFAVGDAITVMGVSKGKGFASGIKRYNFKGGPRTHGQSDRERAPGSIGATTTPGRVYKGKRMAGRMGTDQVTQKGLEVIAIDAEKNILTVKGLVPGGVNGLLVIQKKAVDQKKK